MNRQEQYQNALVDTNKEFFITLIEGIILSAIIWAIGKGENNIKAVYLIYYALIPFGYKLVNYLLSKTRIMLIATPIFWIGLFIVKVIIAAIICIPAFVYQLVKVILSNQKPKSEQPMQ